MREFLRTVLRLSFGGVLIAACAHTAAISHPADDMVGGQLASTHISISGVLDGRRDTIDFADGVVIAVNGITAALSDDGHFAAIVPPSQYYAVTVRGSKVFETLQTFGHAELYRADCACLAVPAIELVARKKGRIELFFGGDSMAGRRYFEPRADGVSVLTQASLDSDLDKLLIHMKGYWNGSDFTSINLESVVADTEPGPLLRRSICFLHLPPRQGHSRGRASTTFHSATTTLPTTAPQVSRRRSQRLMLQASLFPARVWTCGKRRRLAS